jgi:hypothetical protein
MLGEATRPRGSATSLPSSATIVEVLKAPSIQQQAIAAAIADQVLYETASATITSASLQAAQSAARQELSAYLADPGAGQAAGIVPAGISPQKYFLSPTVISSYQRAAVINGHKSELAARHIGLASWMRQQLPTHVIVINGAAPSFSIANSLALP